MEAPGGKGRFEFQVEIPPAEAGPDTEDESLAVPLALETMEDDSLEGSIVWDTGIMMARLLMDQSKYPQRFFRPERRFVELGAGCGLVGLVAALRGARITLTDIESVLPRLHRNVERNLSQLSERVPGVAEKLPRAMEAFGNTRVAKLDWTSFEEDLAAIAEPADGEGDAARTCPPYDVVLATDCIYSESLAKPFLDTLLALTGPDSVVLLAMRARFGWQADFLQDLKEWFSGMPLQPEERHVAGLTQAEDLLALRLRRRAGPSARGAAAAPAEQTVPS